MVEIISNSEQETLAIAAGIASKLQSGAILALTGPLGSGKTAFAKGLAKGLEIKNKITSPTFVIYRTYPIPKRKTGKFYHFDFYRLKSVKNLRELGFLEILNEPKNILAIEWAEKIRKQLPPRAIQVRFKREKTPNTRKITFS